MSLFKKKHNKEPQPPSVSVDNILKDFPRGVDGRAQSESWRPRNYFEAPETIAENVFKDHTRDVFLGIINGHTENLTRDDGRIERVTYGGTPIGINDDRHMITIAGSRSGKGRSAIIPNLLSYGGSILLIDAKGENASRTAQYRAEVLGQDVHVLDPFDITGESTMPYRKAFNPLTTVHAGNSTVIEDAGLIADSLVVPSQGEKDPHWSETAKAFIEGLILHVCTSEKIPANKRTLITVHDLLVSKTQSLDDTIQDMLANAGLNGRIFAAAKVFHEKPDTERGSVLSTARRNLKFLDYDSMREILGQNDFALDTLKKNKTTIYLCLPAMRMSTCKQWLRLFINLTLGMMEHIKEPPEIPVLMIMDEFPILGYMKEIEDAAGQIAGLGVKLWPIIQDLGQLKAIYKDRWETFLGNTGIMQCFGNVDHFTLEHISKVLGKTTYTIIEHSTPTRDQLHSQGATGRSEKQHTDPLLLPHEIAQYFARDDIYCRQLIHIPGRRPFVLSRANYDQHELFKDRYARSEM